MQFSGRVAFFLNSLFCFCVCCLFLLTHSLFIDCHVCFLLFFMVVKCYLLLFFMLSMYFIRWTVFCCSLWCLFVFFDMGEQIVFVNNTMNNKTQSANETHWELKIKNTHTTKHDNWQTYSKTTSTQKQHINNKQTKLNRKTKSTKNGELLFLLGCGHGARVWKRHH